MKIIFSIFILLSIFGINANECKNRGDLDTLYCDEDNNLLADKPKNTEKFKKPKTLILSYTPLEDTAVYVATFKPFVKYLSSCLDKKVVFYPVQSNAAEIEAMRSGRLHIGGFSSGSTPFAVNIAGAIPFATDGYTNNKPRLDTLTVLVKKDSSIQKLLDLKDKKVAHTNTSSNSGHMAPIALFPEEGLIPGQDYQILFSGKYDASLSGVLNGDYDAATMGIHAFEQMVENGYIKEEDFRIIFQAKEKFPASSWAYSHDLEPNLSKKITQCFFDYSFSNDMKAALLGADKFVAIDYKNHWQIIRDISKKNGINFNKSSYDKNNSKK